MVKPFACRTMGFRFGCCRARLFFCAGATCAECTGQVQESSVTRHPTQTLNPTNPSPSRHATQRPLPNPDTPAVKADRAAAPVPAAAAGIADAAVWLHPCCQLQQIAKCTTHQQGLLCVPPVDY
jgi:hypothetical protein